MTGVDHEHSEAVEQAARWLAEHRSSLQRAVVPTLKKRFGLSVSEAIEAAVLAARLEFLGDAS